MAFQALDLSRLYLYQQGQHFSSAQIKRDAWPVLQSAASELGQAPHLIRLRESREEVNLSLTPVNP